MHSNLFITLLIATLATVALTDSVTDIYFKELKKT